MRRVCQQASLIWSTATARRSVKLEAPGCRHDVLHRLDASGSLVAQNAAPTVKRVTQELGGKSPNIILEDADLEAAVTRGHAMYNNTDNLVTPFQDACSRHLLSQAESIAAAVTESVVMGPTEEESTTMGPVISKIQWDKIQGLIEAGIVEGAIVCGGPGLPDGFDRGYYVRPTVFSEVNDMTVAQQEIFGPVLVMIPTTAKRSIRIANDTPHGLAGYVQGGDLGTRAASLPVFGRGECSHQWRFSRPRRPLRRLQQSGNGREGAHGFTDYLEIKAISGFEAARGFDLRERSWVILAIDQGTTGTTVADGHP